MGQLDEAANIIYMDLAHKFVEHAKKHVGQEMDSTGRFLLDIRDFLKENYNINND